MVRNTSTSAPSARATTASTWPGPAASTMEASTSPGWAAPVCPTVVVRSSARAPSLTPSLRASALAARPCMPVTATWSTWSALTPAAFSAGLPRLGAERDVAGLAEALLPHPGPAVAGGAPPVEELVADRGPPEVLGQHRASGPVVPDQDGGGAVPARHLVGRGGQAVAQVGQDDQGRSRARGGQGGAQGTGPGPERTAEVEGGHPGRLAQGGVDGGGVGLVQVGRGGGGEPDGVGSGCGDGPQGQAGRLHPHGGGVLVVGGHRSGPLAAAGPEHLGHGRALQAPIGDVPGDADDASHLFGGPFGSGGRWPRRPPTGPGVRGGSGGPRTGPATGGVRAGAEGDAGLGCALIL